MNPRVKSVTPSDNYRLHLTFTNGEQGIYDCSPLLDFGVFRELQDPAYFRQVRVLHGSVAWPHEQDICPDTLYEDSSRGSAPQQGQGQASGHHALYAVTKAELVGPYTLKLAFDDGKEQTINFQPVLEGEVFGPLKDHTLFNRVRLDPALRTIVWPNGADFDPATLHDWNLYEQEIITAIERQQQIAAESRVPYSTNDN